MPHITVQITVRVLEIRPVTTNGDSIQRVFNAKKSNHGDGLRSWTKPNQSKRSAKMLKLVEKIQ